MFLLGGQMDPAFAAELNARQLATRRIVTLAVACGVPTPALSASLCYFDSYRRARLPANLTQARRGDFRLVGLSPLPLPRTDGAVGVCSLVRRNAITSAGIPTRR